MDPSPNYFIWSLSLHIILRVHFFLNDIGSGIVDWNNSVAFGVSVVPL